MTGWGWRERPADPEELAAADDRAYADLRGPDDFPDRPDRPGQQYRMAQARAPKPGQALQPRTVAGSRCPPTTQTAPTSQGEHDHE